MHYAGGIMRQPVQKLVETIICAKRKCKDSPRLYQKSNHAFWHGYFFIKRGVENQMHYAGGIMQNF